MSVDTKLRHELEVMDEKFSGDNMVQMLGMSTLNWMNVDSSRQLMFNSHIKQLLTLVNPDVPRIQTGFENSIGAYSKAYKKMEGTWEVKDIIQKFPEIPNSHIYTVVFYNKKEDLYEMIEAPIAESLTEKFGYAYNISRMDEMKVGDKIKDEINNMTQTVKEEKLMKENPNTEIEKLNDKVKKLEEQIKGLIE